MNRKVCLITLDLPSFSLAYNPHFLGWISFSRKKVRLSEDRSADLAFATPRDEQTPLPPLTCARHLRVQRSASGEMIQVWLAKPPCHPATLVGPEWNYFLSFLGDGTGSLSGLCTSQGSLRASSIVNRWITSSVKRPLISVLASALTLRSNEVLCGCRERETKCVWGGKEREGQNVGVEIAWDKRCVCV